MKLNKATISARVESALKQIVMDSHFTHGDAYELGAKLIATGDASKAIGDVDKNPDFKKTVKEKEYEILDKRKTELEKELKDLGEKDGSREHR